MNRLSAYHPMQDVDERRRLGDAEKLRHLHKAP